MYIEYKGVNIYQDDQMVLQDVNFTLEEGDFIYIIGVVGAGKSSLLKTFYCELDIDEGKKAEVLGKNMFKIKRREVPALRKQLGVIFQDFQLLHDRSVYKNLYFVLRSTGWKKRPEIQARIEEVLELVGMLDKKDKMPYELSGGEQQRIAIARAILNNPKIIIADEPTGNLDPDTADAIVSLLKSISSKGTAVVMSTHNIPMLDKFPGIVYRCKDGLINIVEDEFASSENFSHEESKENISKEDEENQEEQLSQITQEENNAKKEDFKSEVLNEALLSKEISQEETLQENLEKDSKEASLQESEPKEEVEEKDALEEEIKEEDKSKEEN